VCGGHYIILDLAADASSYDTDDLQLQFETTLQSDVVNAIQVKWPSISSSDVFMVNFTQIKTGSLDDIIYFFIHIFTCICMYRDDDSNYDL
jgi:hypothetical protein